MLEDTYLKNSLIPVRYKEDARLYPATKDEKVFDELA